MADTSEQVLFDKRNVKVTQYRLIVENTVYAVQNITSIRHDICQPPTPPDNYYRNIAFTGAVVLVIALFAFFEDQIGVSLVLAIAGLVLLAYAYVGTEYNDRLPVIIRHIPPATPPATHTVILTSAANEQEVLSNTDGVFISEVLAALNDALAMKRQ